jgi:membrane protein implicated in regulation of membrane protease activity
MRLIVTGIAILYLAIAALLLALDLGGWFVAWSVFEACVLLAALLFERWRYRPQIDRRKGNWRPTAERFVDPTTGRTVQVFYNPDTGERDYVDVAPDHKSP